MEAETGELLADLLVPQLGARLWMDHGRRGLGQCSPRRASPGAYELVDLRFSHPLVAPRRHGVAECCAPSGVQRDWQRMMAHCLSSTQAIALTHLGSSQGLLRF